MSQGPGLKFENTYEFTIRSGETGEVIYSQEGHNDISDDFKCGRGKLFVNGLFTSTSYGCCFLLPDGTAWTGFTWDPTNPWAPYCTTANNLGDTNADVLFKSHIDSGCQLNGPFQSPNTTGKWRYFFRWSALPINLQLKAFGLTSWQVNVSPFVFGQCGSQQQTIFIPQTLVVLPASILVRGRNVSTPNAVASQTPDILEITYYLSIVGA